VESPGVPERTVTPRPAVAPYSIRLRPAPRRTSRPDPRPTPAFPAGFPGPATRVIVFRRRPIPAAGPTPPTERFRA